MSAPPVPLRAVAVALLLALACGAAPAAIEVVAVHDGDTVIKTKVPGPTKLTVSAVPVAAVSTR